MGTFDMIQTVCTKCEHDPKNHIFEGIDSNLFKNRKRDQKLVKDACEEHEVLYSNTVCKPVWKKCCGILNRYEISFKNRKKVR